MKSKFKKGDRIAHPDYGNGTVISVNAGKRNPIKVHFDNADADEYNYYTKDGRENPIGSGYKLKGKFVPFPDSIDLTILSQ